MWGSHLPGQLQDPDTCVEGGGGGGLHGKMFEFQSLYVHVANDVGRAILKLGVGYPLGEKGLDWLKIHLVNLHGQKKK